MSEPEQPFRTRSEMEPTGATDEEEIHAARMANRFDIRRIIGGLFVLYGIIVTIAGITVSDANLDKAEGVNINLWTGLGMLALGVFFLGWLWLRPLAPAPAVPNEEGAAE